LLRELGRVVSGSYDEEGFAFTIGSVFHIIPYYIAIGIEL
jgi:hypothetical protein